MTSLYALFDENLLFGDGFIVLEEIADDKKDDWEKPCE
jgi:hypothetical protein